MHSSLCKELRGTSKIVRAVRPRPSSRPFTAKRKFTSQTRLLNQPNSRDNSGQPASSTDRNDPSSGTGSLSQGFGSEIERWIQILSDQGQSPQIWDSVTEKDENGRRRLLPQIRKDLEVIGDWAAKEARDTESVNNLALKIENGRIRPLKLEGSEQADRVSPAASAPGGRVGPHPTGASKAQETEDAGRASTTPGPVTAQQSLSQDADRGSEQQLAEGGEHPPHDMDTTASNRFYGSSAARRQRERHSRSKDKSHIIVLPKWFIERHVFVPGEGSLRSSAPRSVQSISADTVVGTDKESTSPAERVDGASNLKEVLVGDVESASLEKQQTHATGAGDDSPPSDNSQPETPSGAPQSQLAPSISHQGLNTYFLHDYQLTELILTIQGKLRLSAASSLPSRNRASQSQLTIHYTAPDADLLLDRLVEDVARDMKYSLISLDAQDITSLILSTDSDPAVTQEAENLSYQVYDEIYAKESQEEDDHSAMFSEDMEDDDEDGRPGARPWITGKPIAIADLSSIFGSKGSRHDFMPELFGRNSLAKFTPPPFSSLIDSILSSPQEKRKLSPINVFQAGAPEVSTGDSSVSHTTKDATIVHVKAFNAIMDTKLGKHFLLQLGQQVDRRRNNGESIMVIGTDCAKDSSQSYDLDRIRSMQTGETSGVVLTPGFPQDRAPEDERWATTSILKEKNFRTTMKQDRAKRIQAINARHLYEMLKFKGVAIEPFEDGFWTRNFSEELTLADQDTLSKSYWTLPYIQRLAAILASDEAAANLRGSKNSPIHTAAMLLENSDKLKGAWVSHSQTQKRRSEKRSKDAGEPENDRLAQIRSKASRHEKKLLSGVIEPKKIATTFRDIHIPSETVDALQTLTTLSLVRPDAFKYGVLASDRIPGLLLYGPPGTGKTLAAKAVARESGATMLEVSAANINDMYVGEGEKNVKALFSLAKKLSPCVVFLDEADAMFSARSRGGRHVSHRETLNQFLKEWDGMSNDSGSAFIMVATNRPMDLDDAVLRRLPRRLLVDLPTEKDRLEILKIHLRHEQVAEDVDLAKLASHTQFYSGSDLKNVAVAAALNCVREENELAKKHTGEEPYQYSERRILTSAHFGKALEEITASISDDMASLREIKKFDEQYGDGKGRKRKSPKWGFKTASEADAVLDTVKVRP